MLTSGSTHQPPTGSHWPRATAARTSSKSAGWSSIQAYCAAEECTKTMSGFSESRSRALRKVALTVS
ncbi:hypothetical protein Mterra_04063 [Calidithermus terrae]|uniref:Uncharacterized protein n=1 Tax=Calidithermus terrae TaxID=1408545 RepID=A0A399DSB1_9DEIN|nr:hypothetical protein Mterra_04063 [Calidithermus terrae]